VNKKRGGFTLVEVIAALAVLVIVTIPISNLFLNAFRTNAQARIVTAANVAAHAAFEQLVSFRSDGIQEWAAYTGFFNFADNFHLDVEIVDITNPNHPLHNDLSHPLHRYDYLYWVVVSVYSSFSPTAQLLARIDGIINTQPGGFTNPDPPPQRFSVQFEMGMDFVGGWDFILPIRPYDAEGGLIQGTELTGYNYGIYADYTLHTFIFSPPSAITGLYIYDSSSGTWVPTSFPIVVDSHMRIIMIGTL